MVYFRTEMSSGFSDRHRHRHPRRQHLRHQWQKIVSSMNIHQHHCIAKCKRWFYFIRIWDINFPPFKHKLISLNRLVKNASSSSSHSTPNSAYPDLEHNNGAPFDGRPKNIHLSRVLQADVRAPQPLFNQLRHQNRPQQQKIGKLPKNFIEKSFSISVGNLVFSFIFW